MKKKDVLKSNLLFNQVIDKGIKISNKYFVIIGLKKDFILNNYGIAVGKKVGNAVTRNKIKRQIRNILTKSQRIFPNFHNYIIICKKEVLNLSYQAKENELVNLIKDKGGCYEK